MYTLWSAGNMASYGCLLLIIVLMVAIYFSETKDTFKSVAKSRNKNRFRKTYTTYTTYNTRSRGGHGKGLSWWQITLIIGGILVAFLLIYICVRMCRNTEPESDTPGIHTTRDQIQLRDHQTIHHFPTSNYGVNGTPNGHEIHPPPPPPQVSQGPYPSQQPMSGPPSYDDALIISKKPIGEDGTDQWHDEPIEVDRKDFGVV